MNIPGPDQKILEAAGRIRLIALDVDGVLTDGKITLTSSGEEIKSFHVRDGHAVKLANRAGLTVALITGRESPIVDQRARELGIALVFQGALRKKEALEILLLKTGFSADQIAYMGDDLVDLPVLGAVGLACAPSDADPEVLARVPLITHARGGEGAVREMIQFILSAQGLWEEVMARYLRDPDQS
ncbi:MAG: HAD-IIIA family hydrolase [Proteobacteria bacterium]|nr:HAD-IIIA family hydrolase [Pseudomonadota bacterium]